MKEEFKMENLKWALKLYSLTLILPITFTLGAIVFTVLGIDTQVSFLEMLKMAWVDFYFTGSFLSIDAWRWHIILLIVSFVITAFEN